MNSRDDDYLSSITGMTESIMEGLETPLSECIPHSEIWPDKENDT